jgi:hypothetical protein
VARKKRRPVADVSQDMWDGTITLPEGELPEVVLVENDAQPEEIEPFVPEEPLPEKLVEVEERREDLVVIEFYGDNRTKLEDLVQVAYHHLGEGGALYLTMPRRLRRLDWFRDFEDKLREAFCVFGLNTGTNRYLRNQDVRQRFGLACVKQN